MKPRVLPVNPSDPAVVAKGQRIVQGDAMLCRSKVALPQPGALRSPLRDGLGTGRPTEAWPTAVSLLAGQSAIDEPPNFLSQLAKDKVLARR